MPLESHGKLKKSKSECGFVLPPPGLQSQAVFDLLASLQAACKVTFKGALHCS